jgi:hypothetical protein
MPGHYSIPAPSAPAISTQSDIHTRQNNNGRVNTFEGNNICKVPCMYACNAKPKYFQEMAHILLTSPLPCPCIITGLAAVLLDAIYLGCTAKEIIRCRCAEQ